MPSSHTTGKTFLEHVSIFLKGEVKAKPSPRLE